MTQPPTLSATVLLLRDAPQLEVLMVQRSDQIAFASGALVFPGGKAAVGDADPAWGDHAASAPDLAIRVAALREAYEESGLVLARPKGKTALVGGGMAHRLDPMRGAVDRGEVHLLDLMAQHDLELATDLLVPFGHWITPEVMPQQFDTHFFVAAAPAGQEARQDGRETTQAIWITPQDALQAEAEGRANIIFPTRMNLRKLALAHSVADAVQRFAAMPVRTVRPQVEMDSQRGKFLRIPEVEGYGQTIEPLQNVQKHMRPTPDAQDKAGPG